MVSMSSERASPTSGESGAVVESLRALASDVELAKVRKRLAVDEEPLGLRMGDLFAVARTHRDLPLADVEALLDHPAYEPRLAAICILDFRARRRLDEGQRRELYEIYLRRHDRITTWDMVDRSAPRVVGGYLAGRSLEPLFELAAAAAPIRRPSCPTPSASSASTPVPAIRTRCTASSAPTPRRCLDRPWAWLSRSSVRPSAATTARSADCVDPARDYSGLIGAIRPLKCLDNKP